MACHQEVPWVVQMALGPVVEVADDVEVAYGVAPMQGVPCEGDDQEEHA